METAWFWEEILLGPAVNVDCCCSIAQLCLTLCDPKDCSTPGFRPSLSPGVYSNPCPSSQWCHPTISCSATPFSSCPQSVMWIKGGKGIRRDQEGYHCQGRLWKALAATLWGDAACAEGTRMRSLVLAVTLFTRSMQILHQRKCFWCETKCPASVPKQFPFGRRQLSTERTFLHPGLCRIRGPLTHWMLLLPRCVT